MRYVVRVKKDWLLAFMQKLLISCVSEICVKQIRVNQEVSVFLIIK